MSKLYTLEGKCLSDALKTLDKKDFSNILETLSEKYHEGFPLITDEKYDYIESIYEALYGKNKKIGAPPKGKKVILPVPMFGMNKTFEPEKLKTFGEKYPDIDFVVTDKLDGVSVYIRRASKGWKIYKRGDSGEGYDISRISPFLNLPDYETIPYNFAFRAELVLPILIFQSYEENLSSARSTVSGLTNPTVTNLDIKKLRDLKIVAYHIYSKTYKQSKELTKLEKLGFSIPKYTIFKKMPLPWELSLIKNRKKIEIDIDGLCIAADIAEEYPMDKNPKHILAFKEVGETAVVTVTDLIWQIGKMGRYTPVIKYDSVLVSQAELEKATGHNAKFIVEKGIGIGAKIVICRSGDVIPKIIDVLVPVKVTLPKNSQWDDNGTFLLTTNKSDEQEVKIIEYFFSHLKAKHIAEATVNKLYDEGHTTIKSFFELTSEDIQEIEGFQEKSADRIVFSIKSCVENVQLYKLMVASCIFPGVGDKRIKPMIEEIKYIPMEKLISAKKIKRIVLEIPGIGDSIADIFSSKLEDFHNFYEEISEYVTLRKEEETKNEETKNEEIKNEETKNVVFTGVRPTEEILKNMNRRGYKEQSGVNSKTNILVVKSMKKITSKMAKAQEMGVEVVSLEDFLKMI